MMCSSPVCSREKKNTVTGHMCTKPAMTVAQRWGGGGNIGLSSMELEHKAAVMAHSRSMMPDLVGTSNIYGK
jgi:hypothetical protein